MKNIIEFGANFNAAKYYLAKYLPNWLIIVRSLIKLYTLHFFGLRPKMKSFGVDIGGDPRHTSALPDDCFP